MASPPLVEDQARLLEDALTVVRQQTLLMRRCLDTPGKLMDALKCRHVPIPAVHLNSLRYATRSASLPTSIHPAAHSNPRR
jgi:vacuolar protein sorting-associated protein 35